MAETASSDWAEHTSPEGKKFYHNAKTGVSTWEKPEELKSPAEKAQSSCPWTEHTTDTGRKYYYNANTQKSSWEMPPEFKAMQEALEAGKAQSGEKQTGTDDVKATAETANKAPVSASPAAAAAASTPAAATPATGPVSPHKPVVAAAAAASASSPAVSTAASALSPVGKQAAPAAVTPQKPVILTAADVFKALLRDYKISPGATWDNTMRTIIKDDRYKILNTITERKAAFRDYIEEVKTRDREERLAKEEATRTNFFTMLREGGIDVFSTYRKAMTLFDRDPRWIAVDREKEREELFDDYMWEIETRHRDEEKNNRESNLRAYHQLLDEYVLSVTSQWRKFRDDVKDDPRFIALDKLDRLSLFEHRIRDLERVDAEDKRKIRESLRRQYRKNRDAFRALLQEACDAGRLDRHTRWKRFKRTLKEDPRYEEMIGQPGSTPSELFGDFVEDLQERYDETKKTIDRIMKEGNITITGWMTEDQFLAAISTHPAFPSLDRSSAASIFGEMREAVERRERRDKRKREKQFERLLRSHKDRITTDSVYDDSVRELLAEDAAFKAIADDAERKTLFERFVERLKHNRPTDDDSSSDEEEGDSASDGESDERDRKRRRHSSSDRKDRDRKRRRHSSKDRGDDRHKKRRKDKERKHRKRSEDKGRRRGSVSSSSDDDAPNNDSSAAVPSVRADPAPTPAGAKDDESQMVE